MGFPTARITDMHVCPMVIGVVPYVGGSILPPGGVTVLSRVLLQHVKISSSFTYFKSCTCRWN